MKFSINKIALLEALTVTGKCITSGVSVLPALSCYKFDIDGDRLEITGGDMAVFITQSLEVTGTGFTKSIAVPQHILFGWIKELADQPIAFTIEGRQVARKTVYNIEIVAGDAKCIIPCENGDDYPRSPQSDEDQLFEIPSTDLHAGIEKTMFACANDPLKPALSGLNMILDELGITFNGCDGSNMGTKTFKLTDNSNISANVILPVKTMSIIKSLPCDETVKVNVGKRTVQFQINESTVLRSVLVDAKYNDLKSIIPVSNDKTALIETKSFMGALKRSVQFAPSYSPTLSFDFSDSAVKINAMNDAGEASSETIKIDYTGEPITVRLHGPNTIKCISKIDNDTTKLILGETNKPVMILEKDIEVAEKINLMLTMPIGG